MNQKDLQIIQSMNSKKVEMQLAVQCAPLLAGLKIANLLIVSHEYAEYAKRMLKRTEIICFALYSDGRKTSFLLYKPDELPEYLKMKEVKQLLHMLGYRNSNLAQILIEFRKRYVSFMDTGLRFPHELGLLLGYPAEDVHGFIINKGKNFLYAGYWKVYQNLSEKLKLFRKFTEARENAVQLVSKGVSILKIIEIYSNMNFKTAV